NKLPHTHLYNAYGPVETTVWATIHPITTHDLLAEIWQEVLGVPQVKPDDNFFALGGHSLSAVRMLFKVRERLAAELTMRDLHESADLAALAELIERRRP
ncbi:phosphopantetheine-binding protein, partial [Nonomuraea endophytica]|uniref:phosphopantetheine-binding protein n=1 Tax=Nonomuraea endophytica TaxID=714136 RepID=UPI0037CBDB99